MKLHADGSPCSGESCDYPPPHYWTEVAAPSPGIIAPEVWDAATAPDCPPGVVRFSGQPFPLVEFLEDRDA